MDEPKYRDESWLREKYWGEGLSLSKIAEECGVKGPTILRWMKRNNIDRRDGTYVASDAGRKYRDESWLREQYAEKSRTVPSIADECGVNPNTIYYWLQKNDIERDRGAGYRPDEPEPYRDEDWLREKYQDEQLSSTEIADLCECTKQTILNWLHRHQIPLRDGGDAIALSWKGATKRRERQSELGRQNLTQWHKMDEDTQQRVRERLSEFWSENNPMEGRTGDQNPAWRGGHERYYGSNWKEQRRQALERDKHECTSCGHVAAEDERDLAVHHHVPIRWFINSDSHSREDANQLWNLITLCSECHGNIESKRLCD